MTLCDGITRRPDHRCEARNEPACRRYTGTLHCNAESVTEPASRAPLKRLFVLLALLVTIAGVALVGPVVMLELDDGWAIPSSSDAPDLPAGVTIASDERRCGSGGCWRELTLRGAEHQTPEELAATLDMPEEVCRARSLLDRRRVCTGVIAGDHVRVYLQFERRLHL